VAQAQEMAKPTGRVQIEWIAVGPHQFELLVSLAGPEEVTATLPLIGDAVQLRLGSMVAVAQQMANGR
jgi:hypothetical protein